MVAKLSFVESAIDDTLWTGKMILVEGGGEVWKALVVTLERTTSQIIAT